MELLLEAHAGGTVTEVELQEWVRLMNELELRHISKQEYEKRKDAAKLLHTTILQRRQLRGKEFYATSLGRASMVLSPIKTEA